MQTSSFTPAILFATEFPEYGIGKHLFTAPDHYRVCENDPYQTEQIWIGELIAEIPDEMQAFYVGSQFRKQPMGEKMLRATPITRIRLIKVAIVRVLFLEGTGIQFEYRRKRYYKILCEGLITNLLKRSLPFVQKDFQFIIRSLKSLRENVGKLNYFVLNFPYEWLWKALDYFLQKQKNTIEMYRLLESLKEITPYKIPLHKKIDIWLKTTSFKLHEYDIFGKTVMNFLQKQSPKRRIQWEKILQLCEKYDSSPKTYQAEIKVLIIKITPTIYYETVAYWLKITSETSLDFDFGNLLTTRNQRILQNIINTVLYVQHPIFRQLIGKLSIKATEIGDTNLANFCTEALYQNIKYKNQKVENTTWLIEKTERQAKYSDRKPQQKKLIPNHTKIDKTSIFTQKVKELSQKEA